MKKVSKQFEKVVLDFSCIPQHFTNASILYNNYNTWDQNSAMSVENADIIVYVIIAEDGEITWNTEYTTAKNNGKPFIILCHEKIFNTFYSVDFSKRIKSIPKSAKKIYERLGKLHSEQHTIVPFDFKNFSLQLKEHLGQLFFHGLKKLQEENRKGALIALVKDKSNNYKKVVKKFDDKKFLFEILFDFFQHKEIRKRILSFFVGRKELNDDQIIDLLKDPEQGIVRKTIEILPTLLHDENDINVIFETLVEITKDSDDFGIDRRAVIAMLSIDIKIAINYLNMMMPAEDIGTPRRILQYIVGDLENIKLLILNDTNFKAQMIELINSCSKFEKGPNKLSAIAEELLKKLDELS